MAQYDRQILVPYLRDVCSVELLCEKLARDIKECEEVIWGYRRYLERKPYKEEVPYISDFSGVEFSDIGILLMGAVGLMLGVTGPFALILFGIPGLAITIFGICLVFSGKKKQNQEYEEAYKKYESTILRNRRMVEENVMYKRLLEDTEAKLTGVKKELKKAQQFRDSVYDVNIIPRSYRNVHAAYYLYDYFETTRENDLDRVIQTLLLDEIKARLDKIIIQNEEILLNQRYQIALEEKQNRKMAENHRKQMQAAANMEKNQELQIDYQRMIAKNQMVTNFFLEADYLRNS